MSLAYVNRIGTIYNEISDARDEDWGRVESEIRLVPDFQEGLEGIDEFSHVIVISYLHQASFSRDEHLLRRPRGREDMPLRGIFAQRARHRPNPIGLSVAELISMEEGLLRVRGLDLIHGTPVIDIKPYVPTFDLVEQAQTPVWMAKLLEGYFS